MPWLIGIDEAGYGPNLGPLVMTSVACRVPGDSPGSRAGPNLWHTLRAAVRCPGGPDDGRLLIGDSKQVYSSARGLAGLEHGVLATLLAMDIPGKQSAVSSQRSVAEARAWEAVAAEPLAGAWGSWGSKGLAGASGSLSQYLDMTCPGWREELSKEPWFRGTTSLPVAAPLPRIRQAYARFSEACLERGVHWGPARSLVVCPSRFNEMLQRWDSKGAVLGLGLAELLRHNHDPDDGADPVIFIIDKHGGRNHYSAMVQHGLDDGFVLAREEGALRSVYDVAGLRRPLRVNFQPRADAEHLCVALASMFSKYLREVLMLEFNRFWQVQVPGLKATAGYPRDAQRFYSVIRPAAAKLGILDTTLWRNK